MDLKVAYFGIGCFWAESVRYPCYHKTHSVQSMAKLKGVRKTRAGFAGGTVDNPTSRNCGDHSGAFCRKSVISPCMLVEVVEVRYNPAQCTYQDLLSWFLVHARSMWDHPIPAKVRRYRAVVLYADDEQEQLAAEATRKHKVPVSRIRHRNCVFQQQYGTDPVDVRAEKFVRFYPAVFYYQKYWLRCRPEVIGEVVFATHTELRMHSS